MGKYDMIYSFVVSYIKIVMEQVFLPPSILPQRQKKQKKQEPNH